MWVICCSRCWNSLEVAFSKSIRLIRFQVPSVEVKKLLSFSEHPQSASLCRAGSVHCSAAFEWAEWAGRSCPWGWQWPAPSQWVTEAQAEDPRDKSEPQQNSISSDIVVKQTCESINLSLALLSAPHPHSWPPRQFPRAQGRWGVLIRVTKAVTKSWAGDKNWAGKPTGHRWCLGKADLEERLDRTRE